MALAIYVESRVRVTHAAAAEKCPVIARRARATATLTMSALVHLCVDGTIASMSGTLLIAAGRELIFREGKLPYTVSCSVSNLLLID